LICEGCSTFSRYVVKIQNLQIYNLQVLVIHINKTLTQNYIT